MKHKGLNQLLCAATVNNRFRETLLHNPAQAIATGYFDHTFSLTPETLAHINPGSAPEQWLLGTHYSYTKDIILSKEASRLWVLSDILVLPPPFPRPTAFSVGDLVIAAGIVITLQGSKNPF